MLNQLKDLSEEDAKKLCQGLRHIPTNKQSNLKDITEHWVQGDERYFDIFIHTHVDEITWFQVTFRGFYLEYSKGNFKSGKTHEFELSEPNKVPSTQFLSGERDINTLLIQQIIKIISLSSNSLLKKMNTILLSK